MNNRLLFWAITSALAGFLFGFDTVVISGAEKKIQSLWGLNNSIHGLAMSAALWGTVLGSFVGGWPTDKFGRKNTLLSIGVLYLVSAIWSALSNDVHSFMIARLIGGIGVGISTVAAPLYISEISPPDKRGRLAGMFQFNIVFGILIALLSNYIIGSMALENGWRWMLGIEAIPAVIYTMMCFAIPQSPRWLISKKQDRLAAEKVLQRINPDASAGEVSALADQISASAASDLTIENKGFWSRQLRIPIMLAFLIAFFNQLSGINAILYFAPRIFELAGFGAEAALLNSVGIGITNLLFTFVGLYLIDRLGRRTLLYIGSFGYIASLGLCAWAFFAFAPSFQVANSAMSVSGAVKSLAAAEKLEIRDDSDITELKSRLDKSKLALVAASSSDAYTGPPVVIGSESDEELKAIADNSLAEASEASGSGGLIVMIGIFAFIAAHAIGQGAVIWVFISEIFPNRHRASGQAFGCFTHWIFAALLTMGFPWMISTFAPGHVFGFFCFMMFLQLIWVAVMVPETKGVPLEEMEARLGVNSK